MRPTTQNVTLRIRATDEAWRKAFDAMTVQLKIATDAFEEFGRRAAIAADIMNREILIKLRPLFDELNATRHVIREARRADVRRRFFNRPILWQLRACSRISRRPVWSPVLLWRWVTAYAEAQPSLLPER